MDAHDCRRCRSASLTFSLLLFGLAGAIGFSALPPDWREPIGRSLIGVAGAVGALLVGVLLLVLIDATWRRYFSRHVRTGNGVATYRGEVVYGWSELGRNIQLITRRRGLGMQAHTVKPRFIARRRTLNALRHAHAPQVHIDCDAIGRGILRWGEQPELLPLLQRAGLLDPHRPVFGNVTLRDPTDATAWRELCNAIWKQPHERPMALMLATKCTAEPVRDHERVACAYCA